MNRVVGIVTVKADPPKEGQTARLTLTLHNTQTNEDTDQVIALPESWDEITDITIPASFFDASNEIARLTDLLLQHETRTAELVRVKDALEEQVEHLKAYQTAVTRVKAAYPESVFRPDSDSVDAESARWARRVCENIRSEAKQIQQELAEARDTP